MISCIFEDGGKTSLRHVTVGAIVVNEENQFLLEKRAPHLTNGGKYSLPSGFLDRDEDTKRAVLRELFEETRLEGKTVSLFRLNDNPNRPKEDRQNVDIIYVVTIKAGELKQSNETTELGWFSYDQLPTEEEFAFDHRENIMLYVQYKKEKFNLPIVG